MAIVGLLVMGNSPDMEALAAQLEAAPFVVETQATPDASRIAVVIEIAADKVEEAISHMLGWDTVLSVDVAYVNYEDDIERHGTIPCPVHTPKKKQRHVV